MDRQELQAQYDQAVQAQKELGAQQQQTKKEAADANKKGVEGSDEVTQAKQDQADATAAVREQEQALARAREDYAHDVAQAQRALTEALYQQAHAGDAVAKSANEVASAMSKLSPNAQAFVREIQKLTPAWHDVKIAVQDALFAGLPEALDKLSNAQLPGVRDGLVRIAGGFNDIAKSAADYLSSADGISVIKKILDDTGVFLEHLAPAFKPFLDGFLTLASIGTGTFGNLADRAVKMAENFKNFVDEGERTGSIRDKILKAYDAFGDLGRIIKNVGSILASVFEGFDLTNGNFLDNVSKSTKKWADFLKSAEGKNKMKEYVNDVKTAFQNIKDVIGEVKARVKDFIDGFKASSAIKAIDDIKNKLSGVGKEGGKALGGLDFSKIGKTVGDTFGRMYDLIKPILPLFKTIGEFLGPIVKLLGAFLGPLIDGLAKGLAPVIKALKPLFDVLGPIVGALAKGFGDMLKPIGLLIGFVLKLITPIIKFLSPVLQFLARYVLPGIILPIGKVGEIVGKLGPIFEFLLGPLGKFGGLLSKIIQPALKLAGKALEGFGKVFESVGGFLGKILRPVIEKLGPVIERIALKVAVFFDELGKIRHLGPLFGKVVGFIVKGLGNLLKFMGTLALNIGMGLIKGLEFLPNLIGKTIVRLVLFLVNKFKELLGIHSPSTVFAEIGGFLIQGLINGVKALFGLLGDVFFGIPKFILEKLGDLGSLLLGLGGKLIGGLLDGIKGYVHFVWQFWTDFVPGILKRLADAYVKLGKFGLGLLKSLLDGIVGYVKNVWSFWTEFVPGILKRLGQAELKLVGKGKDFIKGLYNGIKEKAVDVFNYFRDLAGNIFNRLSSAATKLVSKGRDFIRGLLDGAKGYIQNVWDFFKNIPGRIVSSLGNLAGILKQKGKDLIQGLIDGATSLLSKLGTFFLDKVPSFIREPFKKALGIQSPSKVFAAFGRNTLEGYNGGIGDELKNTVRTVSRAADTVSASFRPELGVAVDTSQLASMARSGALSQLAQVTAQSVQQPTTIVAQGTAQAADGTTMNITINNVFPNVTKVDQDILTTLNASLNDTMINIRDNFGQLRKQGS